MATPIDLGIVLGLAYQSFTDELRSELNALGFDDLGSAYGYVFRALANRPLHLHQLASQLGMTNQGAAKIVNEMIERGYLERRPDLLDKRAKELRLDERGRAALAAARRFHARYERRLRAKLGVRNVSAARMVLEAMVREAGAEASATPLRAL